MIRTKADFSLTPRGKASSGNLYRSGKKGTIYCRFFYTRNGRKVEVRRSTGHTTEREARAKAWAIWQHETGHAAEGPAKHRSTSPKLGRIADYITEHRRACTSASALTVKVYVQSMGRAVNLVAGTEGDAWRDLNLSFLSDEFVHRWRRLNYQQRGLDIDKDADADLHLNWNLNSTMQNIRSLFGRSALVAYEDAGMTLPPQLARFLSVRAMEAEQHGFKAIPAAIDAEMRALAAFAITPKGPAPVSDYKVPSVEVAVVYEIARFTGLTNKELVNLRVDWIAEDYSSLEVQPFKDAEGRNFKTKRNAKNGRVPTDPARVKRWLKALKTEPKEKGYFLPGTCPTHREVLCARTTNHWIAKFLPDRTKRLHELRKQAGSDVFHKHGLSAAAAFLRDTEATARKYYLPKGHDASKFGVGGL